MEKQSDYVRGMDVPKRRRFYILPKIHKEKNLLEFLDMPYYLNPLSSKHKSYIKDIQDFLEKVRRIKVRKEAKLFSKDIESLYTNTETEKGLAAVRKCFEHCPDENRLEAAILRLLELSLTKNDFEFDGRFYLQIKGTAMGKKFAPAYANIYMADWEETVFPKCRKLPTQYLRYLDDVWGVWEGTRQEFEEFVGVLNQHCSSIRVKWELKEHKINFLDTITYKGLDFEKTGRLDVKVYFKPTDTHALLHHKSYHEKHVFKGLVKAQLLRFRQICTRDKDRVEAMKTLFQALTWGEAKRMKQEQGVGRKFCL